MSFDAAEFNTLALWLVEQRSDESSLRTSISRTYYAGHLLAVKKLMEQRRWEPKGTGDDHQAVIRELNRGRTTVLSQHLGHLLRLRQHADYHVDASESIGNQHCSFCKKVRESSTSGTAQTNVTLAHWQDAKEVSGKCLPLIAKL